MKVRTFNLASQSLPGVANPQITNGGCSECSGIIEFQMSGGTPPYSKKLDQGSFITEPLKIDHVFSGLCAGSHTITVRDAAGCIGTYDFFIEDFGGFEGTDIEITPSTCGNNGGLDISINGAFVQNQQLFRFLGTCIDNTSGVGQTNFDSIGFSSQYTNNNLAAGTWSITAGTINNTTDKEFICPLTDIVTIPNIDQPYNVEINTSSSTCGIGNGGATVTLSPNPENPDYSYLPINYVMTDSTTNNVIYNGTNYTSNVITFEKTYV